jgi:hypothetical protein
VGEDRSHVGPRERVQALDAHAVGAVRESQPPRERLVLEVLAEGRTDDRGLVPLGCPLHGPQHPGDHVEAGLVEEVHVVEQEGAGRSDRLQDGRDEQPACAAGRPARAARACWV